MQFWVDSAAPQKPVRPHTAGLVSESKLGRVSAGPFWLERAPLTQRPHWLLGCSGEKGRLRVKEQGGETRQLVCVCDSGLPVVEK